MFKRKLGVLAAAGVLGAALLAAPAQARMGGGGGGHVGGFGGGHVGGFGGARIGGVGFARPAMTGGFARPGFAGAAFAGRPMMARAAFAGRPFVNRGFFPHRFAHRRFAPFFGAGLGLYAASYGYSSCWTWAPTPYGWQQVYVCGDYGDYY